MQVTAFPLLAKSSEQAKAPCSPSHRACSEQVGIYPSSTHSRFGTGQGLECMRQARHRLNKEMGAV